ncbi:MAG: branched-chain amino acid ABC transporter permease [Acidaminococcales bacterium]|nr:branched-chain amino acid ABC transporter permease [Acidaminococcales bacterium]
MSFDIMLGQTIVTGLLWGAIYTLTALGLTVIYGIVNIVNFAHGDFLMISMFLAYVLSIAVGFSPLQSLPFVVAALFLLGIVTYRLLIKPVLNAPMLAQIFATFGLMVFLRGLAQFIFGIDFRTIPTALQATRLDIGGIFISTPQLIAAIGAVVMFAAVYFFITKTRTGWALLAVAENREAATLMGIDSNKMFALAWGIGAACVGVAGCLLANFYYVFPEVGAIFGFLTFIVVAFGGFGSITGAFAAGLIIGLIEALAGFLLDPSYKYSIVFTVYLLVVIFRPKGLLGSA